MQKLQKLVVLPSPHPPHDAPSAGRRSLDRCPRHHDAGTSLQKRAPRADAVSPKYDVPMRFMALLETIEVAQDL
jgi:hypothetical protein